MVYLGTLCLLEEYQICKLFKKFLCSKYFYLRKILSLILVKVKNERIEFGLIFLHDTFPTKI